MCDSRTARPARAPRLAALLVAGAALSLPAALLAPHPAAAQGWGQPQQQEGEREITQLQRALERAGYDTGGVDGQMGPGTRAALRAFQRDNGLPVTGQPSPAVRQALGRYMDDPGRQGTFAQGRQQVGPQAGQQQPGWGQQQRYDTDFIADVQFALRRQGYDIGAISGELDPGTRAAIRSFQRDHGLRVTGEPDRMVVAELQNQGGIANQDRRAGQGEGWDGRRDDGWQTGQDQRRGDQQTGGWGQGQQGADGLPVRMSYGELVQRTTAELNRRGYRTGPVDQLLDGQTARAIQTYQQQRGMEPTGEPSRELLADLMASDVNAPPPSAADLATGILGGILGGGQQQRQEGQQGQAEGQEGN